MTTRPLTFLHLTDLHLGDRAANPGLHSDTVANMRAVRDFIDAFAPRPDFIAVSGDLADRGDRESYRLLREIMAGLDAPVLYALGNHDSRPEFHAEMLGREHDLDEPYDHERVVGGLHVITLDTSVPGRIGGGLEDRQFAFLEAALARHPEAPKLLMAHHAPALHGDPAREWESLSLADTARLGAMIEGRPVVGVLSGHVHQDRVEVWRGVPCIVNRGQHCAMEPLFEEDALRLMSGVSVGRGLIRDGVLSMNFTRLPSDERELGRIDCARIRAFEAKAKAALDAT